ncbi:MAG: hypothetical protein EOO25_14660 [Comamonadaceae bacterium]|nr:MAG: hypothetical protein EOO25_14660 [Comamonadaceae bacterium]
MRDPMTDPQDQTPEPVPAPVLERALVPAAPAIAPSSVWMVPRKWMLAGLVLAAAGFVASTLLWQKLGNIQEELARRSADAGAQAIEARTLARQAQDSAVELKGRLALLETRIGEVSLQRSQLEELMQSLSRSRDENLVVDLESGLRLAQQQAQLTGSAEPLLAALRSADQRLARAAQPRLNPLQRAIAKDMDRIKAASLTDVPVLLVKLDELARLADDLPVANGLPDAGSASTSATAAAARPKPPVPSPTASSPAAPASPGMVFDRHALGAWSQRMFDTLRDEARKLLRVSRIEQPEAALLSPEQSFFLRENFKLRLMNARLGLLSRQTDTARADLTSELPRLDDTLSALATAAAGR